MRALQTFLPPANLAAVVKKITVVTGNDPSGAAGAMSYYADGLPGLMFHHSGDELLFSSEGERLSGLFLYGQTVRPIHLLTGGPFRSIVFHFYPHIVENLFGIPARELTDHCVDYKFLGIKDCRDMENRIRDESDVSSQIKRISDSLLSVIAGSEEFCDVDVLMASKKIMELSGGITLRSIQEELNITERSFERKFLKCVGVSPNLFRRICKFNSCLEGLASRRFTTLTDLAYQKGFADQSHFIRTFKEFTGLSPRQYLDRDAGHVPIPGDNSARNPYRS